MISKYILVAALGALPLAAIASPLIPLNSDGSSAIFFVADASITYSDNIFYQPNKTNDEIYRIAPGFELVAGGDGNNRFDLVFKYDLAAYGNHHDLNNQLAKVNAKYVFDAQSAFKATVTGGFNQLAQPTFETATVVTDQLVKTNNFNGGATVEYKLTEKSTVVVGGNYSGIRYDSFSDRFNNLDTYSIPVSWYYAVTEKLDAGFTYQYGHSTIHSNSGAQTGLSNGKQNSQFLGFSLRGKATEKLTIEGNAGAGYVDTDFVGSGSADSTTFNFNLKAAYAITEKLSASISAGRNFGVSAQGDQTVNTNVNLGLSYAITENWSANGSIGYMVQEFDGNAANGRKDKIITASVGTAYKINKYFDVGAQYSYFHDDAVNAQNFNYNMVSITAGVKY